jgi:hypothetical protein
MKILLITLLLGVFFFLAFPVSAMAQPQEVKYTFTSWRQEVYRRTVAKPLEPTGRAGKLGCGSLRFKDRGDLEWFGYWTSKADGERATVVIEFADFGVTDMQKRALAKYFAAYGSKEENGEKVFYVQLLLTAGRGCSGDHCRGATPRDLDQALDHIATAIGATIGERRVFAK